MGGLRGPLSIRGFAEPALDDEILVKKALQGDVKAFNRLVLRYQDTAYNVAYRIMGNGDDAADVVQESFVKAYQRLGQLRGGSFKAWLLRIVTNTCYDKLRYRKRRPTVSIDDLAGDDSHSILLRSSTPCPEEAALRAEREEIIQQGISTLPPDQRAVLVLSDVEGFSYREIAEIVQVPIGTVRSRLARARAKMRDYLKAEGVLP
jgi:RNA polymerase sigma-70 factor (ECF subfamily)